MLSISSHEPLYKVANGPCSPKHILEIYLNFELKISISLTIFFDSNIFFNLSCFTGDAFSSTKV